ncbi:MAG: hypothetical protein WED34_13090, partial [Planctomycetales bacterium]
MPRSLSGLVRTVVLFAGLLRVAAVVAAAPPVGSDSPVIVAEVVDPLPKDGAWARYYLVIKNGTGTELETWKVTLAFVGRAVHEDRPCRVVELRMKNETGDQVFERGDKVYSLLLPEKNLHESKVPFAGALKGRYRVGNSIGEWTKPPHFFFYGVFLPGVVKRASELDEPRTVKCQQGDLEIARGWTGSYKVTDAEDRVVEGRTWDYSTWLHPDLPVGFAHAKFELATVAGDERSVEVE